MEDNDNNNSTSRLKDDGDQNRIVHRLLRLNISGERNVRKYLFWYDIQNFPDSLVIEILVRLPVKSIFMFKSVCKHWRTLISHPSFCRFYYSILNSNAALSTRLFRILYKDTYAPSFPEFLNRLRSGFHSSSDFSVLFLSSREERERNQYDRFRVLDMSNGLILCCSRNSTTRVYYIGHPLTGQWISLSRRQYLFHDTVAEGLMTRVDENHMITGYRVVRVDFLYSGSNYLHLEMFSSETRKWIRYQLPCVIPTGLKLMKYMVARSIVTGLSIGEFVFLDSWSVAFDRSKDQEPVRLIALPNDRDLKSEEINFGRYQLCGECQGTLRYFEVAEYPTHSYVFKMWAMKDYEKGEWCREFKVRRSDLHSTDPELSNCLFKDGWFRPLSFHPLNPNVVYLVCNRRLDFVYKPIDIKNQISWKYVISFLVQRWPLVLSDASQPCLIEGHSEVKRKKTETNS